MKKKRTKRDEQAENTKQKILDAAYKLLGTSKYDDISMTDIAEEAGVSTGALYHHFSSKAELAMAYCENEYQTKLINNPPIPETLHAAQRIMIFLNDFYIPTILNTGLDILTIMYNPANFEVTEQRSTFPILVSIVQLGQERGELKNALSANDLACLFGGTARGIAVNWTIEHGIYSLKKEMLEIMSILITNYIADEYVIKTESFFS